MSASAARPARPGGFREFRVTAKVRESRLITSFHLVPVEASGWQPFEPGQFLVLRVPGQHGGRPVPRSYSISSAPSLEGSYRITVKREVPEGIVPAETSGSVWLHDEVHVGDTISAAGPRGEFVLDRSSPRPAVLLSGGVGLTPMVSMLHALAAERPVVGAPPRAVVFLHACDNGEVHALRAEVEAAAALRPEIVAHYCYRFPTERDQAERAHHSEGVVTGEVLERLLPAGVERDHYMCGPPPFMSAVYKLLRSRGVAKERIAYEFFGPATVLEADVAAAGDEAGG